MLLLSETHDGVLQLCMEAPVQAHLQMAMCTQKLTGMTPPRWRIRRATGSARQVEGKWHIMLCALQTLGPAVSAEQSSCSPQGEPWERSRELQLHDLNSLPVTRSQTPPRTLVAGGRGCVPCLHGQALLDATHRCKQDVRSASNAGSRGRAWCDGTALARPSRAHMPCAPGLRSRTAL